MAPHQLQLVTYYKGLMKKEYGGIYDFYLCFETECKKRRISYYMLYRFLNGQKGWKAFVDKLITDKLINLSDEERLLLQKKNRWLSIYDKIGLKKLVRSKGGYNKVAEELSIEPDRIKRFCALSRRKTKDDLYWKIYNHCHGEAIYINS